MGKKVFFCGWEDSGKRSAKSGGSGVFLKTKRRKAFSIISNYRQRCGWFVRSVAENNGLRGQLRIISIMLLAVALKRWESVGEEAGENVFFYSAGGILFQNASGGLSGFYLIG